MKKNFLDAEIDIELLTAEETTLSLVEASTVTNEDDDENMNIWDEAMGEING